MTPPVIQLFVWLFAAIMISIFIVLALIIASLIAQFVYLCRLSRRWARCIRRLKPIRVKTNRL